MRRQIFCFVFDAVQFVHVGSIGRWVRKCPRRRCFGGNGTAGAEGGAGAAGVAGAADNRRISYRYTYTWVYDR